MNPSFSHIKMVAIDCDETLVRSDNTVSDYTVDVLQRLHKKRDCHHYSYGAHVPDG